MKKLLLLFTICFGYLLGSVEPKFTSIEREVESSTKQNYGYFSLFPWFSRGESKKLKWTPSASVGKRIQEGAWGSDLSAGASSIGMFNVVGVNASRLYFFNVKKSKNNPYVGVGMFAGAGRHYPYNIYQPVVVPHVILGMQFDGPNSNKKPFIQVQVNQAVMGGDLEYGRSRAVPRATLHFGFHF